MKDAINRRNVVCVCLCVRVCVCVFVLNTSVEREYSAIWAHFSTIVLVLR